MKSFKEIQEILGELPNYPKIYLLGSTGAGKTSIVRSIMDTANESFPSTLPTRTTVAPTEYVISSKKPFKSTFIFKQKEDIENSIVEILEAAIEKGIQYLKSNNTEELSSLYTYLEETPDERFRLKYIVEEDFTKELSVYIKDTILPKINLRQSTEEALISQQIRSEITYLLNKILNYIVKKVQDKCKNYTLFSNELFEITNVKNKKEFISKNKELLKSEINSISPLIEYARVEGNLLASWLNSEIEFVLIDGEGIGHNLKEIKSSLSTRHLDFFNFCDSILLVEKSDDPFITGGLNALKTIFLNGYNKKFKLLFSKLDKMDQKDQKAALNRRIINVESALKESNIQFDLNKNQKFYLSNLDKNANDSTKMEIERLFKSIKSDFSKIEENPVELEYDFETLLLNLNTTKFLETWNKKLTKEHWTIVKAFTKRMILNEGEYRYLKPIFEYHTLIMEEVNDFLQKPNHLTSEIYYAQNKIKQVFSHKLLEHLKADFLFDNIKDWSKAYNVSGRGSSKDRNLLIQKIFQGIIPLETNKSDIKNLKKFIEQFLLYSGAKKISATSKVFIKKIEISNLHNNRNIEWNLTPYTNILIGKNGSGKSSILKVIDASFNDKYRVLEKFSNPKLIVTLTKQYESGEIKDFIIEDKHFSQNIDIKLLDTFDAVAGSVSECKEQCEKEQSLLDRELEVLMNKFDTYLIKLNKVYDEKNQDNSKEISRILSDISKGNVGEASNIKTLTESQEKLKKDVYYFLENFRSIIDTMLECTLKSINLEDIERSFTIKTRDEDLEVVDLSSGEKQILIIFLTILLKENKPYILLMDEPENSLHVEWQINFIENIRKLNKQIQIITATHNPILMLDRESDEIGQIELDNEIVNTYGLGTKHLDISSTLLNYPGISSLVGNSLKEKINKLYNLKTKDAKTTKEELEIDNLEKELNHTVANNFIYDRHYFRFINFLKENKNVDFDKLTEISDEEMDELLGDFKDLFND